MSLKKQIEYRKAIKHSLLGLADDNSLDPKFRLQAAKLLIDLAKLNVSRKRSKGREVEKYQDKADLVRELGGVNGHAESAGGSGEGQAQ